MVMGSSSSRPRTKKVATTVERRPKARTTSGKKIQASGFGQPAGVARAARGAAPLDLADRVGTDVGGLREDAAAELGEERNEGGAEAEADDEEGGVLDAGRGE